MIEQQANFAAAQSISLFYSTRKRKFVFVAVVFMLPDICQAPAPGLNCLKTLLEVADD